MNVQLHFLSSQPPGLIRPFGCVRALIFSKQNSDYPAVPATGFLLSLFGEIFFITTKHAVVKQNFDLEDLAVLYGDASDSVGNCIPLYRFNTFSSIDEEDTDQVDIMVFQADRTAVEPSLFNLGKPFDISRGEIVTNYQKDMPLHFIGISPDKNEFNYYANSHMIHFAGAPAFYQRPTDCRAIHLARAWVSEDCPDFNGMSGAPLFWTSDVNNPKSNSLFAGMLIQGNRANSVIRFIEAERIVSYLIDFLIGHLSREDGEIELDRIMQRHFSQY
jgi:hypothetical protein